MELIKMEHKDLTKLVLKYKELEEKMKEFKELDKEIRQVKKEITEEMISRQLDRFNYGGRFVTFIKGYTRPAYEVPEAIIAPSVRIQGGTR